MHILKKFHEDTVLPSKKYATDLAYDCPATERSIKRVVGIPVRVDYKLGFGHKSTNETEGLYAYARSSVRDRGLILSNSVGLIDPEYRGNIQASFYILWWALLPWIRKEDGKWKFSWNRLYEVGDRVIQITKTTSKDMYLGFGEFSDEDGIRGDNGHGSTGVK